MAENTKGAADIHMENVEKQAMRIENAKKAVEQIDNVLPIFLDIYLAERKAWAETSFTANPKPIPTFHDINNLLTSRKAQCHIIENTKNEEQEKLLKSLKWGAYSV